MTSFGVLRPVKDVPNFFGIGTLDQAIAFATLYWIIGRVLGIVDVIIVKHYVDYINRKYAVTMAMADTLHVLTYISREAESKAMFDGLHICVRYSLLSRLFYSNWKNVLLVILRQ